MYGVQVRAVRLGQARVVGQRQVGAVMFCTGRRLITVRRIIAAARATVAIRTVRVRTFDQIQAVVFSSMHSEQFDWVVCLGDDLVGYIGYLECLYTGGLEGNRMRW